MVHGERATRSKINTPVKSVDKKSNMAIHLKQSRYFGVVAHVLSVQAIDLQGGVVSEIATCLLTQTKITPKRQLAYDTAPSKTHLA